MQDLTEKVKNLALEQGAHLVGIASADRFEGAPRGHHPEDLLPGAKSVIVIAQRFFQTILDSDKFCTDSEVIPPDEVWDVQQTMFMFMYNTLNMRMQMIGVQMAYFLSEQGYPALPFPSGGYAVGGKSPNFPGGRYAFFSHRHAAVLAGLGEMGLNNLLLTPKYGPRVRLHSTITTAELTPDQIIKEQICPGEEECGLCLKAETCYGEIYDFEMCGKTMRLAEFQGCQNDLCKRSNPKGVLPYIRYCIGTCPVGKDSG